MMKDLYPEYITPTSEKTPIRNINFPNGKWTKVWNKHFQKMRSKRLKNYEKMFNFISLWGNVN